MESVPAGLTVSETHEWSREEDNKITIGITQYAQEQLGDIVFVELPEVGTSFSKGDESAVIESVKAAADVYCPVDGTVVATNQALIDAPDLINNDPYGEGWLYQIELT